MSSSDHFGLPPPAFTPLTRERSSAVTGPETAPLKRHTPQGKLRFSSRRYLRRTAVPDSAASAITIAVAGSKNAAVGETVA